MTPSPATAPHDSFPPDENDISLMSHLSLAWVLPVFEKLVRALQNILGRAANMSVDQNLGLLDLAGEGCVEDRLVLTRLVALGSPIYGRKAAIALCTREQIGAHTE